MTYVAKNNGRGRKPRPINQKLVTMLEQSYRTGQRWQIERLPTDPPGVVDDLRRELIRAGYQLFPDRTIHKRVKPDSIAFWMTDKQRSRK